MLKRWLGRWGRAQRWLSPQARRVLDVGCAYGFGSALLADRARGGAARRCVVGIEANAAYAREARQHYPWLPVIRADGAALPVRSGVADAVSALDVLEHVADPPAALAEIRRTLRSGGQLVLSVPHRGPLAPLDSLNVYTALRARLPHLPPLEPSELSGTGKHHHFTLGEATELLDRRFTVEKVARTGLGLAETLNLALLLVCRGLLRWETGYLALRYLYFTAYLLEDLLPTGPAGYHLMIRARAR